jgi:flagellar biosynthesis protein FlhB
MAKIEYDFIYIGPHRSPTSDEFIMKIKLGDFYTVIYISANCFIDGNFGDYAKKLEMAKKELIKEYKNNE